MGTCSLVAPWGSLAVMLKCAESSQPGPKISWLFTWYALVRRILRVVYSQLIRPGSSEPGPPMHPLIVMGEPSANGLMEAASKAMLESSAWANAGPQVKAKRVIAANGRMRLKPLCLDGGQGHLDGEYKPPQRMRPFSAWYLRWPTRVF